MQLSVVTMLFRSEAFIEEFYERMTAAAEACVETFEIIFVDDGSPDRSQDIAKSIAERDPRVSVVELSRNFGHHPAAVAGLSHARGERVFLLDVDLEEQPEWLGTFIIAIERLKADVVYGVQEVREGGLLRKYAGSLFYKLFNFFSETKLQENLCTVRLMSRRYVDALLELRESTVFFAGNCAWVGFKQRPLRVSKQRRRSASSYTVARMIRLAIEALTSFTSYPLKLIFTVGVVISLVSGLIGAQVLIGKLLNPDVVLSGWSSLILSVWFLGGVTISFIGVIGIYLSKVFLEAKRRPLYVVRDVIGGAGGGGDESRSGSE